MSIAIASVGAVVFFGAVELAWQLGRQYTSSGDTAFIELGVRQAIHHGNALGVYSRFGWHHPGPALLYLFAPAYALSGGSSLSLILSTWLINGVSAIGAVMIVRAHAGESAARVLALVLYVYMIACGPEHFFNVWNPRLLALPLLLLMISAAAAYSGSAWCLVVALGTASYLVQTHLGTFPVAIAMLAIATIGFLRARRTHQDPDAADVVQAEPSSPPSDESGTEPRARRDGLSAPIIVGTCILALFWIGPLVQEVSNHNGNLSQIAQFYRHPPSGEARSHSLGASIKVVADHASTIPLGPDTTRHRGARVPLTVAFAALGIVTAYVARRRAPFLAAMGLTTTVGLVVAVIAGMRVVGPLEAYLFLWTEALPIPAIVAASGLMLDRWSKSERRNPANSVVAIGLTVIFIAFSFRSIASAPHETPGDPVGARTFAHVVERIAGKDEPFTIRVMTTQIGRAAVFLELDKDGYRFHVSPAVDLYSGNVTHPVAGPTFVIGDSDRAPPSPTSRPVAAAGGLELFTDP